MNVDTFRSMDLHQSKLNSDTAREQNWVSIVPSSFIKVVIHTLAESLEPEEHHGPLNPLHHEKQYTVWAPHVKVASNSRVNPQSYARVQFSLSYTATSLETSAMNYI